MTHPNTPSQPPQWGQPGYQPPQPPKKSHTGRNIALGCGGALVAGLLLLGGCTAIVSSSPGDTSKSKPEAHKPAPATTTTDSGIPEECRQWITKTLSDTSTTDFDVKAAHEACSGMTDAEISDAVDEIGQAMVDDLKTQAGETPEPTKTAKSKKPAPPKTPKVVFKVWGNAPNGVDINYGSDSDSRKGTFKNGKFEGSLPLDDSAMFYNVMGQLQGGGDINCSVTIDGETKKAHAAGGYNICHAQLNGGLFGGWD